MACLCHAEHWISPPDVHATDLWVRWRGYAWQSLSSTMMFSLGISVLFLPPAFAFGNAQGGTWKNKKKQKT
jgi:hypothetical protein